MRIYKSRGVTKGQVVLVTILGVFGGVYIWQPLFVDFFRDNPQYFKTKEKPKEPEEPCP